MIHKTTPVTMRQIPETRHQTRVSRARAISNRQMVPPLGVVKEPITIRQIVKARTKIILRRRVTIPMIQMLTNLDQKLMRK